MLASGGMSHYPGPRSAGLTMRQHPIKAGQCAAITESPIEVVGFAAGRNPQRSGVSTAWRRQSRLTPRRGADTRSSWY